MIRRLRLLVIVTRPAVLVLLGLFTATGLAQAGLGEDNVLLARALAVVTGFLLFSVACNDLADEAVDRVNLPGDPRRPLVSGLAGRRDLAVTGAVAAVVALAVSATLHWPAVLVTAAGLALSAGYSLRPVRLADRGAVASLVLPACYVAVPYLLGVFAVRAVVRAGDLLLLAGLYAGFIGRILLKDFRDVRGDAMFGKRTFLIRHGRRWTCVFSAWCWVAGTILLLTAVRHPTPTLVGVNVVCLVLALGLLRALSRDLGPRHDEAYISAIAIVGRGMVLTLLAHLSMTGRSVPGPAYDAIISLLAAVTVGQAAVMGRRGPATRLTAGRVLRAGAARPPGEGRSHPASAGRGRPAQPCPVRDGLPS
jgi:4-hydroxybenzoate polyprenyltransferase